MTKITAKSSKWALRRRIAELEEESFQIHAMISSLPGAPFIRQSIHLAIDPIAMSPATRLGLWFHRQKVAQ